MRNILYPKFEDIILLLFQIREMTNILHLKLEDIILLLLFQIREMTNIPYSDSGIRENDEYSIS